MNVVQREALRTKARAALRTPYELVVEDRTDQKLGHHTYIRQAEPQGGCQHGVLFFAEATGWSNPNETAEFVVAACNSTLELLRDCDELEGLLALTIEQSTAGLATANKRIAELQNTIDNERGVGDVPDGWEWRVENGEGGWYAGPLDQPKHASVTPGMERFGETCGWHWWVITAPDGDLDDPRMEVHASGHRPTAREAIIAAEESRSCFK